MKILKGILSESKEYYLQVKDKINKKLADLPRGSVKERMISGKKYYYLQQRCGKKVVHQYLGKKRPEEVVGQVKERKALRVELKKISEALKIIRRSEGRRHG